MDRHEIIQCILQHHVELAERFDVRGLALYGAVARGMEGPKDDVDALVEFEHAPTFEAYMGLKRFLERQFRRRVDLSTPGSLEPDAYADVMTSLIHVIGDVTERAEASRQAAGAPPLRPLRERVIDMLHAHRAELERKGVRSVWLFGSVARGEPGPHSDVDVLVDYISDGGMFEFIGVMHHLEDLLHRPVDLVTRDGLRDRIRASVEADAILIWGSPADDATADAPLDAEHPAAADHAG